MTTVVAAELELRAAETPSQPFVKVGTDGWRTFADLDASAARVAGGLANLGVARGDRVAVICTNRIEAIELLFACARIGAILVPLNYYLRGEFLAYQLSDSGATVLVVDEAGASMSAALLVQTDVRMVIALDVTSSETQAQHWSSLASSQPLPRDLDVSQNDPMAIVYTSGTTGLPKGCVLSQGYYLNSARALAPVGLVRPGDRVITCFPHFHASLQMNALMGAMVNGASLVLEPAFHASTFVSRARTEGATVAWGIAAMGLAILKREPDPNDADNPLRLCIWSTLEPEHQLTFERRFATSVVAEIFGQTEANPIALESPDAVSRLPFAEGRASNLYDLRIVDADDVEVADGVVGEIVLRPLMSNAMFSGYWRRPADTLATIRNLWHHTGDLGRKTADGRLFFVDRMKDSIRRRGENVSCYELEHAVHKHPAVVDVAATAVPSPMGEDDIKLSMICSNDASTNPQEWFEFFRVTLPYFAVPRYVEIREVLPRTGTGKIQKAELRAEGVHDRLWDFEELGLLVERGQRRS